MEALSLYELNNVIRRYIRESFPGEYWVQAELSDVRIHSNGHCYLEFIQKDPRNNALLAKARGNIWANVFSMIRPYFEQETGQTFVSGLKVLVKVTVDFHELYGYSLTVADIDPTYTLGDMARRKREILNQLEEEGVLTLNKELELPVLLNRIAVISSPTAAGYGDFSDQLQNNPYGFVFYTQLFPAIMQGERVEETIIDALDTINSQRDNWDAVVIIRGGGATSDLSGFDTYLLAANCAQFPLPVITGIGHERDDTVLDMIAHTRVKTPTAAAEFLVNHMRLTAQTLEDYAAYIVSSVSSRMQFEKNRIQNLSNKLPSVVNMRRFKEEHRISFLTQRLSVAAGNLLLKESHRTSVLQQQLTGSLNNKLIKENHRISLLQQQVNSLSPENILKRGFSITLKDGKVVTNASQLNKGDKLITRLWEGEISSEVIGSPDK